MKKLFRLIHQEARRRAAEFCMQAPDGWVATFSEPTRTLDQNAAQWPVLQAFADQKQLCINGAMVWASAEDWKDVLTALFKEDMRVAVLNGRMILLGQRTSQFSKKKFSDWMEFLHAMAAEMDVDVNYLDYA